MIEISESPRRQAYAHDFTGRKIKFKGPSRQKAKWKMVQGRR